MVDTAGVQLQRSGGRHQQEVAQVRMACPAEVSVAEAHDGRVLVAVSGTVGVCVFLIYSVYIVRDGVRVGA